MGAIVEGVGVSGLELVDTLTRRDDITGYIGESMVQFDDPRRSRNGQAITCTPFRSSLEPYITTRPFVRLPTPNRFES